MTKVFGSRNDRLIKELKKSVALINALEPAMQSLSDEALRAKTEEFKQRLVEGVSLDSLLPEAFAVVREASVRTLKLRHFDVQLMGGVALHLGKIAEMCTGEGKTLVSTLAAYLNALTGQGVHIVTVNDYLAKRDADWMRPIYDFLGLSVGVIVPEIAPAARQANYTCDVLYATNNELGFDYLRDNMALRLEDRVQTRLAYAIIDEVDSILIDEARTPLIISGALDEDTGLYVKINALVNDFIKEVASTDQAAEYTVDEKAKQVHLTDLGHQHIERLLQQHGFLAEEEANVYDIHHLGLMHHVNAALRAGLLYKRDVDYIVQHGEVVIVDEHTGRTMEGRRWSDGLHQAVEAREGVAIQNENQTLASITFQNYFRLYNKLSGMTGTADTEAHEFHDIYNLEVVVIPTNKLMARDDRADQIYLTQQQKFKAIVAEIKVLFDKRQPVLVGTTSIEASEYLAQLLQNEKIPHQVLNAKHHAKEALIIAEAGRPGAVTIATNMAGRGTDIVLGGNLEVAIEQLGEASAEQIQQLTATWQQQHDEVLALGGLYVLGTERHESRRIDNQLRGRAGRQGDPGVSQFYLSLEDNLMRIFSPERAASLMKKLGMKEDEVIMHPMINRAIENAQRKVEGYHFDIRKQLLQYDDVANEQRKVIYEQRYRLLTSDNIADVLVTMRTEVVHYLLAQYITELQEEWDLEGLARHLAAEFHVVVSFDQWLQAHPNLTAAAFSQRLLAQLTAEYQQKMAACPESIVAYLEKMVMLRTLDAHWKEHLSSMDQLRQGIHLRGYAQKDPVQEYKRESFMMFQQMLSAIQHEVVAALFTLELPTEEEAALMIQQGMVAPEVALQYQHDSSLSVDGLVSNSDEGVVSGHSVLSTQPMRAADKVGRNEPCPCGSGKKFKLCHGR